MAGQTTSKDKFLAIVLWDDADLLKKKERGLIIENKSNDYHEQAHEKEAGNVEVIQRKIFVGIGIRQIKEVNNVEQTFRATLFMDIEWQPTKREVYSDRQKALNFSSVYIFGCGRHMKISK